jgi:hypothetical protein
MLVGRLACSVLLCSTVRRLGFRYDHVPQSIHDFFHGHMHSRIVTRVATEPVSKVLDGLRNRDGLAKQTK